MSGRGIVKGGGRNVGSHWVLGIQISDVAWMSASWAPLFSPVQCGNVCGREKDKGEENCTAFCGD